MHFCADMVRDETHDPLTVCRREAFPGVSQSSRKPVDPQATVGIEHDFHDGRIFCEWRSKSIQNMATSVRTTKIHDLY
jgi:hypothetical protein